MTLQQKKSRNLGKAIEQFRYFKKEIQEYVKEGSITQETANLLIEDMAEQLDL